MNTTRSVIEAIQIMQFATSADDAADVASLMMAEEGFLGGRVYPAINNHYDHVANRLVGTQVGWNVQMFYKPGTASGRRVVLIPSMQRQCGMI